jgi:TonB family protein
MLFFVAMICGAAAAAQTEPVLITVNLPNYPPLARQARIEGVVRLTFILSANATDPTNIEVVSGHPMLKAAAVENIKTWRFDNPYAAERKYEVTFSYRLSGVEVAAPTGARVTFDSYRQVEVVTDAVETTVIY